MVYIREAHPVGTTPDGRRQVQRNERDGVIVSDPKTIQERQIVAAECAKSMKIAFPILLDNLDDAVERAYAGWPDRLYVIDVEGKVALKGAPGPGGFKPSVDLLPSVMDRLLGMPSATPSRPGFGAGAPPFLQRMKEQLDGMLQRMGMLEKERGAVMEMWEQKWAAFQSVTQARQELMMSLRNAGHVEETSRLLTAFNEAVKKYTARADELDRALDQKIEFSKKAPVQALLTVFGVLGVNLSAPMMGGPGGGPGPRPGM